MPQLNNEESNYENIREIDHLDRIAKIRASAYAKMQAKILVCCYMILYDNEHFESFLYDNLYDHLYNIYYNGLYGKTNDDEIEEFVSSENSNFDSYIEQLYNNYINSH